MKKSNQAFHLLIIVIAMAITFPIIAQQKSKPNILFFAVDDLKPILGCYGNTQIKTPNIDRLAKMGTVFNSNYCQQAVCGPTRASIMTGKRPDNTGVWDLKTRMRDVHPDILSLPQHLITQGYSTQGIGKIYDNRCVDKQMDAPSWSVPYYNYFKTEEKYYAKETGAPLSGQYQSLESKELATKFRKEAQDKGMNEKEIDDYLATQNEQTSMSLDQPAPELTRDQAKEAITQQKLQTKIQTFVADLKAKAKINYFIKY